MIRSGPASGVAGVYVTSYFFGSPRSPGLPTKRYLPGAYSSHCAVSHLPAAAWQSSFGSSPASVDEIAARWDEIAGTMR